MGTGPMQLSALRNNHKYGRKQQPRIKNGPRQERSNGPPSSNLNSNVWKAKCWNCGLPGHRFDQCRKAKRVQISMLNTPLTLTDQERPSQKTSLSPIANDDEEVSDLSSEGAVDPAIQAEVPLDLHATVPTCQERTGMRQPIQIMVVTRQNTADDRLLTTEETVRPGSRTVSAGGAPRDVHEDGDSPCVHANLPAAEQEEGWYAREDTSQPREGPRREGMGTNETWGASRRLQSTTRRQRPTTRSCFGQALQSTRATSVAANSSTPTMATPSVVVPPQATAIQRLGKENIPSPPEPVGRLAKVVLQLCRPIQVLSVVLYLLFEPTA